MPTINNLEVKIHNILVEHLGSEYNNDSDALIKELKQFISNLRQADKEALIKMLPEAINEDEEVYRKTAILTIRNYYENN